MIDQGCSGTDQGGEQGPQHARKLFQLRREFIQTTSQRLIKDWLLAEPGQSQTELGQSQTEPDRARTTPGQSQVRACVELVCSSRSLNSLWIMTDRLRPREVNRHLPKLMQARWRLREGGGRRGFPVYWTSHQKIQGTPPTPGGCNIPRGSTNSPLGNSWEQPA
eukprot:gene24470-biopygen13452